MRLKVSEDIERTLIRDSLREQVSAAIELWQDDPERASHLFEGLAKKGSITSLIYLAEAQLWGIGLEKNPHEAERNFARSAELGSIEGAYRLARLFQKEGRIGEAINILKSLSDIGFSPAPYTLGHIYYENSENIRGNARSISEWKKAEKLGSIVAAQWLSYLYRNQGTFPQIIIGYVKFIKVIILGVYYRVFYPQSERIRNW